MSPKQRINSHPGVDEVEKTDDGTYMLHLKSGWKFESEECHTRGYDTIHEIVEDLEYIVAWPEDPELEEVRA